MAVEVRTAREKDGGFVASAVDTDARWSSSIGRAGTELLAKARATEAMVAARDSGIVSASLLRGRTCFTGEDYRSYLAWHGLIGGGFGYSEIVKGSRRFLMPRSSVWMNILPALALAHLLRARMIEAGGHGLAIHAAHRMEGGAPRSKHRLNAALDLDILSSDYDLAGEWLRVGARVWNDHAHLKIGMGSYHPEGTDGTRRLHVDAKVRWRRAVWQYSGSKKIRRPAIAEIARRL